MRNALTADRLRGLPSANVLGVRVPIATRRSIRLLGLAHLDLHRAGPGLLIPRCRSVHTFGMHFALDLYFLDERGGLVERRLAVPPRRFAFCGRGRAVLEVPAAVGGEIARASA